MGNVLFRLPESERSSSDWVERLGTPQTGAVSRKDGKPLESGLPEYLVEPLEFSPQHTKYIEEIQLVDFGECE
jgi:serine/threonine-protein kinase SRPK3